MTPQDPQNRTPEWKLERYVLGELPPEEMDEIRSLVETDPELLSRVAALVESNRTLLEHHPVSEVVPQIRLRAERNSGSPPQVQRGFARSSRDLWRWIPRYWHWIAIPGAVALLFVLVPGLGRWEVGRIGSGIGRSPIHETSTETRIKGDGPGLRLLRRTASGVAMLRDSDIGAEGDLLLIQYEPAGRRYGCIVSVDGIGVLTQHLPPDGDRSAELERGHRGSVEFAYELDDAPRWERFFFVTSEVPFDLRPILGPLQAAGTSSDTLLPHLPPSLHVSSFTLRKEPDHD